MCWALCQALGRAGGEAAPALSLARETSLAVTVVTLGVGYQHHRAQRALGVKGEKQINYY